MKKENNSSGKLKIQIHLSKLFSMVNHPAQHTFGTITIDPTYLMTIAYPVLLVLKFPVFMVVQN